jgi:DNA-binding transcriptional regulator LsrR (DeoR family)
MPKLDAITETILRRYYLDDASKMEIGQELGISRFKVARAIQEAKRLGLVRIEIAPAAADADLSEALRRTLGLRQALVVPHSDGGDDASHRRLLASLGAQLVSDAAGSRSIVGFASSKSLVAIVDAIEALHDCTVVQLNGVPSQEAGEEGPVELVRRIAAKTSNNGRMYYAPFVVGDAQAAEALRRDPMIRSVTAKYASLDLAVVTVGATRVGSSSLWDAADEAERADILARGGVGEICGVVFDSNGEHIATPLSARTIAIEANVLAQVREVIAVVTSDDRSDAVYAAAMGKWITSLVTSDVLARDLLRLAERRGARPA